MKNKPFEHGKVIKKDLTVAVDSLFNEFKTKLKYAMQLSSSNNLTGTRNLNLNTR
jgi:hypothetical protein